LHEVVLHRLDDAASASATSAIPPTTYLLLTDPAPQVMPVGLFEYWDRDIFCHSG
jgi:hypothetical protein